MNIEPLEQIIKQITPKYKVEGRKIRGSCPFAPYTHSNKTDEHFSFAAFADDGVNSGFICSACHRKGNIYKLVFDLRKFDNTIPESLLRDVINAELGSQVIFGSNNKRKRKEEKFHPIPESLVGDFSPITSFPKARQYVENRGISVRVINRLGLKYCRIQERIIFPVRHIDKKLYGFTGRSIHKDADIRIRDYFGLPKRFLILGSHLWKHGKPVILVEGLFGFAHLHQIGIDLYANIGAVMGSCLTSHKVDTLEEFGEPVYLLFDNDDGGDNGLFGPEGDEGLGAVSMLKNKVITYVPEWPEGKEDPDQLTKREVLLMLRTCEPYID